MITCRDLALALGDVVDGGLPSEHHVALQEHLDGCPDCTILKETYQLTISMARRLQPPPLPASLLARLQERLGGPSSGPSA